MKKKRKSEKGFERRKTKIMNENRKDRKIG